MNTFVLTICNFNNNKIVSDFHMHIFTNNIIKINCIDPKMMSFEPILNILRVLPLGKVFTVLSKKDTAREDGFWNLSLLSACFLTNFYSEPVITEHYNIVFVWNFLWSGTYL